MTQGYSVTSIKPIFLPDLVGIPRILVYSSQGNITKVERSLEEQTP